MRQEISVINPATGKLVRKLFRYNLSFDFGMFMDLARKIQKEWAKTSLEERLKLLGKLKRYIQKNYQELVGTIQSETGKTWPDAMVDVISAVAEIHNLENRGFDYAYDESSCHWLLSNKEAMAAFRPHGVVGVISPWNLPLAIPAADIFPAILLGNAVLWKPSEWTPLTALKLWEFMAAAGFPERLLQILIGYGDLGEWLCKTADYISFTGSCRTGEKVKSVCYEKNTPCNLEMGGKAPAIVLADANIERTANALIYGGFSNLGQYCKSFERVYVDKKIFDAVVDCVVERVKRLWPAEDYGPFITSFQRDIVESQIKEAENKGAKTLTGGTRIGIGKYREGNWFLPTVLTGVDHSMSIMRDETFGPVLPFMPFNKLDEAIRLANDSHLGLNASVFTQDKGVFLEIAEKLKIGNVVGNDAMINWFIPDAPQSGMKGSTLQTSGLSRHGKTGLQRFGRQQTIVWHSHPFWHMPFLKNKELWWMPYGKLTKTVLEFFLHAF